MTTNETGGILENVVAEDQAEDNEPNNAGQDDPWAQAFDALAAPAVGDDDKPEDDAAQPAGEASEHADQHQPGAGDADLGAGADGGPLPAGGEDSVDDGAGDSFSSVDVEAAISKYQADIEEQAAQETFEMFLNRVDEHGNKVVRQTNGQLGATINDPDIYRVDPNTGVATFYNPDTGRPFSGDNPRAQAKQWVEDYNEELRDAFNQVAAQQQEQLSESIGPVIELLKFTPTYDALDSTRQQMLDALIEDYELYDDAGEHIGYSIDLNKALAQVNKQVSALQANRKAEPPKPPTSPAVDMPTSGGGNSTTNKEFTSLAEAMEAQQNAQLEKLRK